MKYCQFVTLDIHQYYVALEIGMYRNAEYT